MAYTYSKLASYTVGSSGINEVSFLAIPQNYTDLIIKLSARTTRAYLEDSLFMKFNNDSGSNYSKRILYGNGATAASGGGSSSNMDFYICGDTATASTFSNVGVLIPNYNSSNYKSASVDSVTENNATTSMTWLLAGVWNNSSAINSITFTPNAGTLKQYSTFTLYGVKAEV